MVFVYSGSQNSKQNFHLFQILWIENRSSFNWIIKLKDGKTSDEREREGES